jgi:hypothetical protein
MKTTRNPTTNKLALKLHGEASRYDTLAARAALRAVTGDPRKRETEERLAREHALRAETYLAAAALLNGKGST